MARQNKRTPIPMAVRNALWIAAAGRCEFRGCNDPVSRDFLTRRTAYVGELAHIVADSPGGPRGDIARSTTLAKDAKNLMLMCYGCHGRIDRKGKKNEYSEADLLAMKGEHETRIELVYSATGVKDTLPVVMTFPVGPHLPIIDVADVQHAIIENSKYKRFPCGKHVHFNRSDFDITDGAPDFWSLADAALVKLFETRLKPLLTERGVPTHLTIAAFGPMPLLMKLGALLGDKMDATVLDLPMDGWLWKRRAPAPEFVFDVPRTLPREVAVEVNISNQVADSQLAESMPLLRFSAKNPNRGIVCRHEHVQDFRRQFNAFMLGLVRAGARVVHVLPAAPLSVSVELGRLLLGKTLEEVHVWDWQAPRWVAALRLR